MYKNDNIYKIKTTLLTIIRAERPKPANSYALNGQNKNFIIYFHASILPIITTTESCIVSRGIQYNFDGSPE